MSWRDRAVTLPRMPAPARWTNAGAMACLAVALGGATCAAAPLLAPGRVDEIALSTLGLEIFLGLAALALVLPAPVRPARRLGLRPGRLSRTQLALLALGTLGLSHGLDGILAWTGLREVSALAELDAALAGARGRSLGLAVVCLGLAPAIGEELMCRGVVQRGLEARLGAAAAIPLAALFFGALHLEPIQGGVAMLLGLYLGTVAWLAGSIRASIFCHMVNNLVAVLSAAAGGVHLGAWTLAAGLALAALVLALVWWRAGSPAPLEGEAGAGAPPLEPPEPTEGAL